MIWIKESTVNFESVRRRRLRKRRIAPIVGICGTRSVIIQNHRRSDRLG